MALTTSNRRVAVKCRHGCSGSNMVRMDRTINTRINIGGERVDGFLSSMPSKLNRNHCP